MSDSAGVSSLSTVAVVLFIAAGALFFVMAALLTKRQIMRFSLRSARRPHISIGSGAPKALRQAVQEKLDGVCKIKCEPILLNAKVQQTATSTPNHYYYRMRAVDAFSKFDEVLREELEDSEFEGHHPTETVRSYLFRLRPDYLISTPTDLIKQFSNSYEHARHDPTEFGETQYNHYIELLEQLISGLRHGVKKKSEVQVIKGPHMDTQVVYKPDKGGETETQTVSSHLGDNKKDGNTATEVRQRGRAGSSAQSSFLDSGHSSHQSTASVESFQPHSESPERMMLIDKKGQII